MISTAAVVLAVFALAVEDVEGRVQIATCGTFSYFKENDGALSVTRAGGATSATCDTGLSLGYQQLTSLPPGVFNGLTLTASGSLYLGNNQLTSLQAGVFDGLTVTGSLDLQNNQLTSLPPGVFNGLTVGLTMSGTL